MPALVESIAYSGDKPWHGFGQYVENLSPKEMLKAADLDWTVSKRPLFTAEHEKFNTQPVAYSLNMPSHFSLVRDSDNKILGICGPEYTPFQNAEVFDFFNSFADAGKMKIEVAGSMRDGKNVWALAKINEATWELMGGDINYTYLLMSSPHIWGEALDILFTSIRVVCWNTLTLALGKKVKDRFRYSHRKNFSEIKVSAEIAVAQAMAIKELTYARAKVLAETKIANQQELFRYYAELVQPSIAELPELTFRDFNRTMPVLVGNYNNCPGAHLESAEGTWWGAYNGYTRYIDFQRGKVKRDNQLWNAWLSTVDAVMKRKAFDRAYDYAVAA